MSNTNKDDSNSIDKLDNILSDIDAQESDIY